MKKTIKTLIAALTIVGSAHLQADVAVVVSANSPVSASQADISRLFLGKLKKFSDGTKAEIVYAKEGSVLREEFDKKALSKSPSQIKAYWSKLLFSGKGSPPKELSSDAEIKAKVASGNGVIGYINADAVDGTVKVLTTY